MHGVANAKLEFSGEARFQIFSQKYLLGNIKYSVSFEVKLLKSNGFRQNITLSKHWSPTSKLFGNLDWFLTLETSGIGEMKNHCYIAFSPVYPKI